MNALDTMKKRIADLKAELAELEAAARVVSRFESKNGSVRHVAVVSAMTPETSQSDESEAAPQKTIQDFAHDVLKLGGNRPMHFKIIADEAEKLGYKSRRASRNPRQALYNSFWATMSRSPEFVGVGRGSFQLAKSHPEK
jgi:hypothetical protein